MWQKQNQLSEIKSFSIHPQQIDNDIMDILLFTKASKKQMSRSKSNYRSEGLLKLFTSVIREMNTRKWKDIHPQWVGRITKMTI